MNFDNRHISLLQDRGDYLEEVFKYHERTTENFFKSKHKKIKNNKNKKRKKKHMNILIQKLNGGNP